MYAGNVGGRGDVRACRELRAFCCGYHKSLSDENLRRSMSAAGIRHAEQFQWDESAKRLNGSAAGFRWGNLDDTRTYCCEERLPAGPHA